MTAIHEIDIQAGFRRRLRYDAPAVSAVAIPNAGKRGAAASRQAIREGLSSGFPDVVCLWDGGWCLIEFKTPIGRISANQSDWLERLERWGHPVKVCRSVDDALAFLRCCGAPFMTDVDCARQTGGAT